MSLFNPLCVVLSHIFHGSQVASGHRIFTFMYFSLSLGRGVLNQISGMGGGRGPARDKTMDPIGFKFL